MTNNELPVIRIKDAWLLRNAASKPMNELWGKGEPLYSDEYYEQRTKDYTDAWKPYESKILKGMTDIIDLSFRQHIVDVYIAPWFHAFSDPMVIGVMRSPDEFIDVLTHELLHRLLTDSTLLSHETKLLDEWKKLFGANNSFVTTVHIPVHAIHKAIYLDVLGDASRLERDIAQNVKHQAKDYIAAWDYVQDKDYREIIEKLKSNYKKLSSS